MSEQIEIIKIKRRISEPIYFTIIIVLVLAWVLYGVIIGKINPDTSTYVVIPFSIIAYIAAMILVIKTDYRNVTIKCNEIITTKAIHLPITTLKVLNAAQCSILNLKISDSAIENADNIKTLGLGDKVTVPEPTPKDKTIAEMHALINKTEETPDEMKEKLAELEES